MTKAFLLDLAERVVATFLGAALTFLVTNGIDLTSLSVWQGAGFAGFTAAVALLKGLAARYVGDRASAGLLK
jgi:hypothetical protein